MRKIASVLVVLVGLAGLVSADQVRVNYDYAATGIDEGQGMWSLTIDSGLIPNPAADPNDPNVPAYLDPNTAVTFLAPMATPVFTQRDALLEGDVIPDIAGLAGWTNDATNRGKNAGMSWEFYGPNDLVTLYGITEGYIQYTFTVQTILNGGDDKPAEERNKYRWAFNLTDNPAGLDYMEGEIRTVSYYGNVGATETNAEGDVVGASNGHRHTGNRWRNDDAWGAGQQVARSGQTGNLGDDAQDDGIGVSLGCRVISGDDAPGTASLFFYNVVIGGDVFADTDAITTNPDVL